jgi:hypothetical protein
MIQIFTAELLWYLEAAFHIKQENYLLAVDNQHILIPIVQTYGRSSLQAYRTPKIALPILTIVLPSSIAIL